MCSASKVWCATAFLYFTTLRRFTRYLDHGEIHINHTHGCKIYTIFYIFDPSHIILSITLNFNNMSKIDYLELVFISLSLIYTFQIGAIKQCILFIVQKPFIYVGLLLLFYRTTMINRQVKKKMSIKMRVIISPCDSLSWKNGKCIQLSHIFSH